MPVGHNAEEIKAELERRRAAEEKAIDEMAADVQQRINSIKRLKREIRTANVRFYALMGIDYVG